MANDIVISGISGRFPESESIAEFSHNLFNKVDLLSEDERRWETGLYELPKRTGKLKDISKFDNQYFGVHHKQAQELDPQARILLEVTDESIADAGYDSHELRGKNIGVFIGNCFSESTEFFCNDPKKITGYSLSGCLRSMFANRISYAFDFKGPSIFVDTACSSGASALYEAVRAIRSNECEAAIVGASNLCLKPLISLEFLRLNMLSADGFCKSFDAASDGISRSEAIVALLIQKSEVARRNYASIVHIKTNTDGFKEEGPTFPSTAMQKQLMREVYDECKLNPLEVSYVEAHGTGTPAGDPAEMSAIAGVFCPGREKPLLVGSVKSNMGHAEGASGLCSLVKILISMERGIIPPNLHFHEPNPKIKALADSQVKIVTDPTPWKGSFAALSNFGFGGVNVHAVLKSNAAERNPEPLEKVTVPQLTLYGGRTEDAVQHLFNYLENEKPPREFFALLHKSAFKSPVSKPYRGYKLLVEDQEVSIIKKMTSEDRPVWYIFSGMGSQWPGMAMQLMRLDVFARSIRKSSELLNAFGLNLIDFVINGMEESNERKVLPTFVSITSIQVALVDVLNKSGISPNGIIGHSLGELGCAYADGSLTAEQTVLASYWRGKAIEDSDLEIGAMAALGMTWSEAEKFCPRGIFPACHNAEDSVTVSGPKDSVKKIVDDLIAKNIFAKEVDSCGFAFHSQYTLPAVETMQTALEKVIPNPKPRSSRWISSSYSNKDLDDPSSKSACASYFVKNFTSPVLFHEALQHVPKNAIVIEIAPHHLLLAILKRVIGPDAEYVGLMKRNVDNVVNLLTSVGRLYIMGLNPDIEKLYPHVQYPVPKSTPMISPLIKWDHSVSWCVPKWDRNSNRSQMVTEINVGSDNKYILDHCIDGRCLYPATGYLVLVWKGLAEIRGKDFTSLPVTFEEVKIHRTTLLTQTVSTNYLVEISNAGVFEVSENCMTVCTGIIHSQEGSLKNDVFELMKTYDLKNLPLDQNDIYKELKFRGYFYGPTFQGLVGANIEGNKGLLKWTDEWVVFLDTMLHITLLDSPNRVLCLPTQIHNVKIDPFLHRTVLGSSLKEYNGVPVFYNKSCKCIISGGVEFRDLKWSSIPRNQIKQIPVLEEYRFIPYNETKTLSKFGEKTLEKYIHVCSSVAKTILELSGKNKNQTSGIMEKFKKADALIEHKLKSNSDNHVLLKCLCGIEKTSTSTDVARHVKHYINIYLSERDKDILYQSLLQENPLRTIVDVVLENFSSERLEIAEIAETSVLLSTKISEFFQTLSAIHINYTIAHTNPHLLNKDNLPSRNFELSSWNSEHALTFKDIDLFMMKFLNHSITEYKKTLENALLTMKNNGFLLLLHRTCLIPAEMILSEVGKTELPFHSESDLDEIFKDLKLHVICKKSDSFTSTMYLLRKCSDITFQDILIPVVEVIDENLADELRKKIGNTSNSPKPKRIWLLSELSKFSGIIGLANCLRKEPGGSSIRCILTDKETPKSPAFKTKLNFYQDVFQKNLAINIFRRGTWGSFRYLTMSEDNGKIATKNSYLSILTPGDLSSLLWVDSSLKYFKQPVDNFLCQVYYAALNFRDAMLASGKLTLAGLSGSSSIQECILGLEFSGRLENGQRVMGLVPYRGLATTVSADPNFMWEVPDNWSLEEASTVPLAYSTAYYALIMRGNLRRGERILIYSGSGSVGQAAIAIALSIGCEVFTTVGSSLEREFLKNRYNELQDKNIFNFRDILFEQSITSATNGEGVDVVLNYLSDAKLNASLSCLAQYGRFLEIGKYELNNNTLLEMAIFLKNISLHGILLDALFKNDSYSVRAKREVVQLIKDGVTDGTVRPLSCIVFNYDDAEQAFRFMGSSKHKGKVVLMVREEESQKKIVPTPVKIKALSRTQCNPEKSYVVIEGLNDLGLELCQWLVERGARHVVLTSRSGLTTGYHKLCLNRWKKENINIIVSKLNEERMYDVKEFLKMAKESKPVAAIFNLALVSSNASIKGQRFISHKEICDIKVTSTYNLDIASREYCSELEYFVCTSSFISGRGMPGLGTYAFASSAMERMCENRLDEGLPGLAIQWGSISDFGVIEDTIDTDTFPQNINAFLTALDRFLQQNKPIVSSFVPCLASETTIQKVSKHHVLSTVGSIFGIKDMSGINQESSLGELGMDSLMAVELRQFLERDFNLVFEISELRHLKVRELQKLLGDSEEKEKFKTTDSKIKNALHPALKKSEKKSERVHGYFSSLSSEQLVPDDTILQLNSVDTGTPLFIVHPVEGTVEILSSLAHLIKFPVYGIQCTPDAPLDSTEHLSTWYWKHIKLLNISSINLAGHSFGMTIVLEMCLQAEQSPQQHPEVCNLIMLDGSLYFENAYTGFYKSYSQSDSVVEKEAKALCSFALQFINIAMAEFKEELLSLPSFADRVRYCVEKVSTTYSNLQQKDLMLAFDLHYKKILMFLLYFPRHKLTKEVVLIKASDNVDMAKYISENYDLEKVFKGKITVNILKGSLGTSIIEDGAKEISKLLNDILSR